MTTTQRTLTIATLALAILLVIPVVGHLWAPFPTSEMMGGRRMVWGFLWLLAVVLALVILLAIGAVAGLRRLRR